jgi:hypothetical protein
MKDSRQSEHVCPACRSDRLTLEADNRSEHEVLEGKIVEFSRLGLRPDLNVQWAVLDTFDMYSPAHDHPQSLSTLRSWFEEAGFENILVRPGPNGVVGSGNRPRSDRVGMS